MATKKRPNISKADAQKLLHLSSELVVTLRSWGLHLPASCLATKDADTRKPVGGYAGDQLEALILKIRS